MLRLCNRRHRRMTTRNSAASLICLCSLSSWGPVSRSGRPKVRSCATSSTTSYGSSGGRADTKNTKNPPHHTKIDTRKPWSDRETPQRYANSTMCYRDEQTGELNGLSRVRAFTQDDAHVFCREGQVKEEFLNIWDIVQEFYGVFGFTLTIRLSFHDPKQPEKYLGDKSKRETAERILREITVEKGAKTFEGHGEAAFYGPKLDFMAKDSLGREWQVATIQL